MVIPHPKRGASLLHCKRLILNATVPLLEPNSRSEPQHWLEYEIDSTSNWLGILECKCFIEPILRANARLRLDAASQFRIKGGCLKALFAHLEIPATVPFPSKPSTVSGEPLMATFTPKPPHNHTASADSAKFDDVFTGRLAEPSSETFYHREDQSPLYPNTWARIRLATGIIYHSS